DGGHRVDVREAGDERSLFDSLPVAAVVFDEQGRDIVAANVLAHRLYGYPARALVGHRVDDIVEDVEGTTAVLHRKMDGSFFHAGVAASATTFRGRSVRLAVIQDASERERLLRSLREATERCQLLFDAGPLARWLYDVETLRIVAA